MLNDTNYRFALTKVRLPLGRKDWVDRASLGSRLHEALTTQRLVVLCAPAGYGKTSLLSKQLATLPSSSAVAWIQLDEHDDLPRFIACLAASLEPYDVPWRLSVEALAGLAQEDSAGVRAVAAEVCNALSSTDVPHGVLALDDLHAVSDGRVFEFLKLLVRDLPEPWTLAIASRVGAPFPTSKLRVEGKLSEFRHEALSFDKAEILRLGEALGAPYSPQHAQRLLESTHGWIAGLCLSHGLEQDQARMSPALRKNQNRLFDFLAAEVLDQLPNHLRNFLVRCSVLPELTIDGCRSIVDDPRIADWLLEIEERGLFVSVLEGPTLTLRLNDIFRSFLSSQLRREHPDELRTLLASAARVESDPIRKIELLRQADDREGAEEAIASTVRSLLASGDVEQAERLLEQQTLGNNDRSPALAYLSGMCALPRYDFASLSASMAVAASGFARRGESEWAHRCLAFQSLACRIMGHADQADRLILPLRAEKLDRRAQLVVELCDYVRTSILGPSRGPSEHMARMLDLLKDEESAEIWYACAVAVYPVLGRDGIRDEMRRFLHRAVSIAGDSHGALAATAHAMSAWVALWEGKVSDADRLIRDVETEHRWLGKVDGLDLLVLWPRAFCATVRGDVSGLKNVLTEIAKRTWQNPVQADERAASRRAQYQSIAARLAAATGQWDLVRRYHKQIVEDLSKGRAWPHIEADGGLVVPGLIALHEGRTTTAVELFGAAVEHSSDVDRCGLDAAARIGLAIAHSRAGSPRLAWLAITPLMHARPEEVLGGILLVGPALLTELTRLPASEAGPGDLAAVAAWAATASAASSVSPIDADPDRTELSGRELQVLERIARGDTNKKIARELGLSPHTVKRHVAHVLSKLDCATRQAAAAWYRNRGDAMQLRG